MRNNRIAFVAAAVVLLAGSFEPLQCVAEQTRADVIDLLTRGKWHFVGET